MISIVVRLILVHFDADGKASTYTANGCCVRHRAYDASWVQEESAFQEIMISGNMVVDHMPDRVAIALESVASGCEPGVQSSLRTWAYFRTDFGPRLRLILSCF